MRKKKVVVKLSEGVNIVRIKNGKVARVFNFSDVNWVTVDQTQRPPKEIEPGQFQFFPNGNNPRQVKYEEQYLFDENEMGVQKCQGLT